MNNSNWIFDDGVTKNRYTSFPYAFRTMFNAVKKGVEAGKNRSELTKKFKIISPVKRTYTYDQACSLATDQGLLTLDGQINSREFKRK
jgi:hypothetical protein